VRGRGWVVGVVFVGIAAVLASLAAGRPALGARLNWELQSMLHPPGAGGQPLQ
jgi:hypothetical protein